MRIKSLVLLAALLCLCSSSAWANQIVLEGSDATADHHDALYTEQLFTFMQGGSSLPVLILGGVGLSGLSAGQSTLDPGYSLSGYTLSNYSAVYIETPGGCCGAPDGSTSISAADKTAIAAAEVTGVTGLAVTIENYGGGPTWGAILPAAVDALPAADFGGITSYGTAGGPSCTDREVFNANGLGDGFLQPPILSCYEHQAYLTSAFTGLGFLSLVNADPAYFGGGGAGSALLALGGALGTPPPTTTPEPSTLLMLGTGLLSLAAPIKRKLLRRS